MDFLTSPIEWWIAPFTQNPFMQDALLASLLVVLSTSVAGTWVVLKGLSFLSDALAHGILPGVAIAFIIGFDVAIGGFLAALIMVLGVSLVRKNSELPDDTSIGLLFVGFLSLAVIILSKSSVGDLNRFLFGSVTGIDSTDLWKQAITALIAVVCVTVFFRPLLVTTFDETQAQLLKFKPKLINLAFNALLAIVIVSSFETVGNLLVFAFLIGPPATASIVVSDIKWMMPLAVAFGVFAVFFGLIISYHYGTAPSATMALVSVSNFAIALVVRTLLRYSVNFTKPNIANN